MVPGSMRLDRGTGNDVLNRFRKKPMFFCNFLQTILNIMEIDLNHLQINLNFLQSF